MDTVGETALLASAKKGKKKNWGVCCQQRGVQQLLDIRDHVVHGRQRSLPLVPTRQHLLHGLDDMYSPGTQSVQLLFREGVVVHLRVHARSDLVNKESSTAHTTIGFDLPQAR